MTIDTLVAVTRRIPSSPLQAKRASPCATDGPVDVDRTFGGHHVEGGQLQLSATLPPASSNVGSLDESFQAASWPGNVQQVADATRPPMPAGGLRWRPPYRSGRPGPPRLTGAEQLLRLHGPGHELAVETDPVRRKVSTPPPRRVGCRLTRASTLPLGSVLENRRPCACKIRRAGRNAISAGATSTSGRRSRSPATLIFLLADHPGTPSSAVVGEPLCRCRASRRSSRCPTATSSGGGRRAAAGRREAAHCLQSGDAFFSRW